MFTRRNFFKYIGASSAALLCNNPIKANAKDFEGYPGVYGVLHDTTLCIGCRTCEASCNQINELPKPEKRFNDLSVLEKKRRPTANSFTVVNKYNVDNSIIYIKTQCNHCLEPACASSCFVKAFSKTKQGAVSYNEDVCVGCRYCMMACPFRIPAYEYDSPQPVVKKCTFCYEKKTSKGLKPACVENCPTGALVYGKRDNLIEQAKKRIHNYSHRYISTIYGEHEMGGTSWLYLSSVPFEKIGLIPNLGVTPAPKFTKGMLDIVPMVISLWPILLTGIYAINKKKENDKE